MLIIFDLDDTLIDTSGSITPYQLQNAVKGLIDAGVVFQSEEEAMEFLLRLNKVAPSAKSAIEEFFEINDLDHALLPIALSAVYEDFSDQLAVEVNEMAHEVLQLLSEVHKLALVTVGKTEHQMFKLKKAGIDSTIFSKIVVTQQKNKKIHYHSIVSELDVDSTEVVVCGDRIPIDLTPAKELGYKTIHMRSGRGVYCKGNRSDVDFTISRLSEIPLILPKISSTIPLMDKE